MHVSGLDGVLAPFYQVHLTALEGAEIIPGKHSDTRIKPLPLTNGHGRYMAVAPERILQSPSFKVDPRGPWDLRRRTEIIPVKDFHTRIKPLALASGHGRYTTVTPERTLGNGRCI
jgi:hypothetical protein